MCSTVPVQNQKLHIKKSLVHALSPAVPVPEPAASFLFHGPAAVIFGDSIVSNVENFDRSHVDN